MLGLFFIAMIPARRWFAAQNFKLGLGHLALAGAAIGFLTGIVATTGPINAPFFLAYWLVKGLNLSIPPNCPNVFSDVPGTDPNGTFFCPYIYAAVNAGLTGVAMPPSRHAASIATTSSTRLGNITASTLPSPKPCAASWPATAADQASSCP